MVILVTLSSWAKYQSLYVDVDDECINSQINLDT